MSNSLDINRKINILVTQITNSCIDFHKRKTYLEYLITIPHVNIDTYATNCIISMISDSKIPIETRYTMLTNKTFNNNVLKNIHMFWFYNFDSYPIRYKILSAQYLLNVLDKNNSRGIVLFLKNTSKNLQQPQNTRIECVDILKRSGYYENEDFNVTLQRFNIHESVKTDDIKKLTEKRRKIVIKRRSLYDDKQNVHTTSINESVKNTINKIFNLHKNSLDNRIVRLNEISTCIISLSKSPKYIQNKDKIIDSFEFIITNTSTFENNLGMTDILILVYECIKSSVNKDELTNRLMEELIDMNKQCVTGHLSRIVNVLSGFFEDVIVISYKDQIKNYVFNHFNKVLFSHLDMDKIIDEMIEPQKPTLFKMIEEFSNKTKLRKEFLILSDVEFEQHYNFAVNAYCGI